jgi:hypothetical protein
MRWRECVSVSLTILGSALAVYAVGCSPAGHAEANAPMATAQTAAAQEDTSVAIAIDFSKSFAPFDLEKKNALNALLQAVKTGLKDHWPSGTVYVSAIGTSGLKQTPPCGAAMSYRQTLITSPATTKEGQITSKGALDQWGIECVAQLVKRSARVEDYTDISGAIALAADWTRPGTGRKLLCVFSDFVEDLPQGSERAAFKLNGERVLMLWAPQSSDRSAATQMFQRLDEWEQRFRKAGASMVLRVQIAGLTADRMASWIQ